MAKQQPARERASHSWERDKVEEHSGWQSREVGRIREGSAGARRPAGRSTARDVTSINPHDREPVDPESPFLIPA